MSLNWKDPQFRHSSGCLLLSYPRFHGRPRRSWINGSLLVATVLSAPVGSILRGVEVCAAPPSVRCPLLAPHTSFWCPFPHLPHGSSHLHVDWQWILRQVRGGAILTNQQGSLTFVEEKIKIKSLTKWKIKVLFFYNTFMLFFFSAALWAHCKNSIACHGFLPFFFFMAQKHKP